MEYKELQKIAKEVLSEANKLNNLSRKLYWYSPKSRKIDPANPIGYYDTDPKGIRLEFGCKMIMVFPRLAFQQLEPIINKHLPSTVQIAYREDYRDKDEVGFDVYQRVEQLKLFIEANSVSSKEFTLASMLKKESYWLKCQDKALNEIEPPMTKSEKQQVMKQVIDGFNKAKAYLQCQSKPNAKLCVRRKSGYRHRMVRVIPADETQKLGFSDLVFVFGSSSDKLPDVSLPRAPKAGRKKRSDSIAEQYKANSAIFKYYKEFGIFEVYDK